MKKSNIIALILGMIFIFSAVAVNSLEKSIIIEDRLMKSDLRVAIKDAKSSVQYVDSLKNNKPQYYYIGNYSRFYRYDKVYIVKSKTDINEFQKKADLKLTDNIKASILKSSDSLIFIIAMEKKPIAYFSMKDDLGVDYSDVLGSKGIHGIAIKIKNGKMSLVEESSIDPHSYN